MGSWIHQAITNEFHYCEPKEINYLMMKDAFLRYVQSHPEIRTVPRLEGVAHALSDTWPCPNENTRTIQILLSELGYDVGEADGFLNPKTKQAIHQYQVDNHMPAGETSNKNLLDSLGKTIRAARQTKDIDKK